MAVKLGRIAGTHRYLNIADDSLNNHIALFGISGGGKTTAGKCICRNIVADGGTVLVLDYSGSFAGDDSMIKRIKIYEDGLPFPLLTPIRRPDGSYEDFYDIRASVLDVFANVSQMGVRQRAVMRDVITCAIGLKANKDTFDDINEMGAILCEISLMNRVAETVYDRYCELFNKLKSVPQSKIFEAGKITVLDLSQFSLRTQRVIAELILAIIWRYFRIWGQEAKQDLFVFCDEFQLLSLREEGILSQILREGRKFHLSLVLATQTLESFSKQELARIQQCGTKLFFRPGAHELTAVLRWIGAAKSDDLRKLLPSLDRGECIAVGRFEHGKGRLERPIKMTFRSDRI